MCVSEREKQSVCVCAVCVCVVCVLFVCPLCVEMQVPLCVGCSLCIGVCVLHWHVVGRQPWR